MLYSSPKTPNSFITNLMQGGIADKMKLKSFNKIKFTNITTKSNDKH